MQKIISYLLLNVSCLSFAFSSLIYASGRQEISEPCAPPLSFGRKSPPLDSSIIQEDKKGGEDLEKLAQGTNIENEIIPHNKLSASFGPNILEALPREILGLILWYVSGDGSATSSLYVNKDFHSLLQENNQHHVNRYLLADLPLSDRKGKTPAELYRLHRARVKSSVADFWEMPSILENVYSSPYWKEEMSFIMSLLYKIYPLNKRAQHFMSAKGNIPALLSQNTLSVTGVFHGYIQDRILFFMQHQDIQQLPLATQENIKQKLTNLFLRIKNILFSEKKNKEQCIEEVLQSLKAQGEEWSFSIKDTLVDPFRQVIQNIYTPSLADDQKSLPPLKFTINELFNIQNEQRIAHEFSKISLEDRSAKLQFIEKAVEREIPSFILIKIQGLWEGSAEYAQDLDAARRFLEELIQKENQTAKELKIDILTGLNPVIQLYPVDLALARELNEEWIMQGDKHALERKIAGLSLEKYGYLRDISSALKLIEEEKNKGDKHAAMRHEMNIYLELVKQGKNQLQNDPDNPDLAHQIQHYYNQIHFLINQLIQEKDRNAFNFKIEGLKKGEYGYTQVDSDTLRSFIEEEADFYHPEAISRKLVGLYLGEEGYTQDLPALSQYISSLHEQGFREASYLKAIGLKFGVFGFQENPEDARKFILQHRIAF